MSMSITRLSPLLLALLLNILLIAGSRADNTLTDAQAELDSILYQPMAQDVDLSFMSEHVPHVELDALHDNAVLLEQDANSAEEIPVAPVVFAGEVDGHAHTDSTLMETNTGVQSQSGVSLEQVAQLEAELEAMSGSHAHAAAQHSVDSEMTMHSAVETSAESTAEASSETAVDSAAEAEVDVDRRRRRRRHHVAPRRVAAKPAGHKKKKASGLKKAGKKLKRAVKKAVRKLLGKKKKKKSKAAKQAKKAKKGKKGEFDKKKFFATLSRSMSWKDGESHCTSLGLQLCKASDICTGGPTTGPKKQTPVGGVRKHSQVYVPVVNDKSKNSWVSIGKKDTCEVKEPKKWGDFTAYKKFKGEVACCNTKGLVKARLSRWEGFLVKSKKHPEVYIVENGERRWIPNPATFEALGFNWNRIVVMSSKQIKKIPKGANIPPIQAPKNSKPFVHANLGYDHDGGRPWDNLEGKLIKKDESTSVYMVERGYKRGIPSAKTFEAMGFEWKNIDTIPKELLDSIPSGATFPLLNSAPNSVPYRSPTLGLDHAGSHRPSAETISAKQMVHFVYQRILERQPNSKELAKWVPILKNSRNVPAFVRRVLLSKEYLSKNVYRPVVESAYQVVLERAPSAGTMAKELASLTKAGNRPIKKFVKRLVRSKEHRDRFLKSNRRNSRGGVTYLYRHVLGRSPDKRKTVKRHARNAKRRGWDFMIDHFFNSGEYDTNVHAYGVPSKPKLYQGHVRRLYRVILNREGQDGEVNQWSDAMRMSGFASVVDAFLNSKEYLTKCGSKRFFDATNHPVKLRSHS